MEPDESNVKYPHYKCRCPDCQCDATTPYETHICYTCRGGEGVAHVPFEPSHHAKARTSMPAFEPIK